MYNAARSWRVRTSCGVPDATGHAVQLLLSITARPGPT